MTFSTRLIKKVNVSFKQIEGTNSISIYCLWIGIRFLLLYFKTKLQIIVYDLLKMARYLINVFRESFHNSKLLLLKGSENKCIFTWRINYFSDLIQKCWYEQSENLIIHWLINIILKEKPNFLEMCQITFPVFLSRENMEGLSLSFFHISSEILPSTRLLNRHFLCHFYMYFTCISQMKFRQPEYFKSYINVVINNNCLLV